MCLVDSEEDHAKRIRILSIKTKLELDAFQIKFYIWLEVKHRHCFFSEQ